MCCALHAVIPGVHGPGCRAAAAARIDARCVHRQRIATYNHMVVGPHTGGSCGGGSMASQLGQALC